MGKSCGPGSAEERLLWQIDELVVEANNFYPARRYRDAIGFYRQAETLIGQRVL
jgi:hypothetical protein